MSFVISNPEVPTGFNLIHTLSGEAKIITRFAWSPDGQKLAAPSKNGLISIWDVESGELKQRLNKKNNYCVAWSNDGQRIASGGSNGSIFLWDAQRGAIFRELSTRGEAISCVAWSPDDMFIAAGTDKWGVFFWDGSKGHRFESINVHQGWINTLAWAPFRQVLAFGADDGKIRLWEAGSNKPCRTLVGHSDIVNCISWSPDGRWLVSGSKDSTIGVWDVGTGQRVNTLEAHTDAIIALSFSFDGNLLASKSQDGTVRLWRCQNWETLAILTELSSGSWFPALAFHPSLPILATLGGRDTSIRIWSLDFKELLGSPSRVSSIHYTTAKIALVGESGVGKTCLGWRLAYANYKDQPSTHGEQFWILDTLKTTLDDGTECEVVLWDFAGQPDYRLVHTIFLDHADLALILFDATNQQEPLKGVEFWLKALAYRRRRSSRTILVGSRIDRGEPGLMREEIEAFCEDRNITGGYVPTSALLGTGIEVLIDRIKKEIYWDEMTTTVTTETFKRIKEYILEQKAAADQRDILLFPSELRRRLELFHPDWDFTDSEMMTAIAHLRNHGYVMLLRSSSGEVIILLAPDLLTNLASSFVIEARRNPKGLGALEEKQLLNGQYSFKELDNLDKWKQDILLDATTVLFLEHNTCFRESLGQDSYLVFPALINQKKPRISNDIETQDDVSYTVRGAVGNIYAALVVLLGYTNTFTRTNQWHNQAQYEVSSGEICGFRQIAEREGEIDVILYYSKNVPKHVKLLVQGLIEMFLSSHNVDIEKYQPVVCSDCGYYQERSEVISRTRSGKDFLFCSECGLRIVLPKKSQEIALSRKDSKFLNRENEATKRRTAFETALTWIKAYLRDKEEKTSIPSCFISYAWGNLKEEQWLVAFVKDLHKAGINVIWDKEDNAAIGSNIARFISLIEEVDYIIVVGTPEYFEKYKESQKKIDSVLAAEMDLINNRLTKTEERKKTVLPILLEDKPIEPSKRFLRNPVFPPLLQGRVHADFRNEESYPQSLFDLILTMFKIPFTISAVRDLRYSLRSHKRD